MAELRRQSVWGFTVKRSSGCRASLFRHERERRQSAVGESLARRYEPINDFQRRIDGLSVRSASEHERDPEKVRQHLLVPRMLAHRPDLHQQGSERLPILLVTRQNPRVASRRLLPSSRHDAMMPRADDAGVTAHQRLLGDASPAAP
jgi:hypothetical protein